MDNKQWLHVLRLALAVLVVAVPFSRIHLGAHWATDVIAGYFVRALLPIVRCQGYARWYRGPREEDEEFRKGDPAAARS